MVSRYGVRTRVAEKEILRLKKQKFECPKCGKKRVKRVGTALWRCKACGAEFAGGAYAAETTVGAAARKVIESLKQPQ